MKINVWYKMSCQGFRDKINYLGNKGNKKHYLPTSEYIRVKKEYKNMQKSTEITRNIKEIKAIVALMISVILINNQSL